MIFVNATSGHLALSREEFRERFGIDPAEISNDGPHIEEGRRLRVARCSAGLLMKEIADAVTGWTRVTVSDIEHGRVEITPMIRAAYQKTISAKKMKGEGK